MKPVCLAATLLAIAATAMPAPAGAQTYPDRMVTLINPFPPGASTDQVSRLIQPKLQAALGRTIVIESKSGAGGNIGTAFVARSAPDGDTLLSAPNANFTITPPITTIAGAPLALVVHKSLGVNSVPELIAYAKKKYRGQLSFGSSGVGSPLDVDSGLGIQQFRT